MGIKNLIKKAILPNTYSMEAYRNYLRSNGVIIGDHTVVYSPNHTNIDIQKPWLVRIGDYCKITKGVTILAHDYSIDVPRRVFGEFRGGSLPVTLGDNVFVGSKSTILMGTTIGDNSIIGANSVVKGDFSGGGGSSLQAILQRSFAPWRSTTRSLAGNGSKVQNAAPGQFTEIRVTNLQSTKCRMDMPGSTFPEPKSRSIVIKAGSN